MLKSFIENNYEFMLKTLKELCLIPAPSHMEHARAQYCKELFYSIGGTDAYIDDALNVILPVNYENSNSITVVVAHTDTVFPDTEPMPYSDDGSIVHCPGVGDDTASVCVMMAAAKYFLENGIKPKDGIMFVCNSCEEGLGNLKGTRQLFSDFDGRIAQFISFDSKLTTVADTCAGSHRYEVEVMTEGGHSYGKFGNANAINELAKIITAIYSIDVPQKEGARTTYNVGNIEGGTSVNTIAQNAKMLCEYRSSDKECLEIMQDRFEHIFKNAGSENVQINVTRIGDRPCSDIDDGKIERLRQVVKPIIESVINESVTFKSSSTDCNIPLSLGIPAICIGVYRGGGSHTREEWVEKESVKPGLEIAIKVLTTLTGESYDRV